jgi:hypothetical protein
MNQSFDEMENLYEHLNCDHDGMRDRLLSQLPSYDTRLRGTTSGQSLKVGSRVPYRWLARAGAGLAASMLLIASAWVVLYWSPALTLA